MEETLRKSPYDDLTYAQLSKLINDPYADEPDSASDNALLHPAAMVQKFLVQTQATHRLDAHRQTLAAQMARQIDTGIA